MMAQRPTKTNIRSYAVKGDDVPKIKQTNILAYAVTSDDGKRPKTLKPGKIFNFFWRGLSST